MKYITHGEAIDGRQRITKLNRMQADFQEEQAKFQRVYQGLLKKYGCDGLRAQINWDTTEIEIQPERVHYTLLDSLTLVAGQDFTDGPEPVTTRVPPTDFPWHRPCFAHFDEEGNNGGSCAERSGQELDLGQQVGR